MQVTHVTMVPWEGEQDAVSLCHASGIPARHLQTRSGWHILQVPIFTLGRTRHAVISCCLPANVKFIVHCRVYTHGSDTSHAEDIPKKCPLGDAVSRSPSQGTMVTCLNWDIFLYQHTFILFMVIKGWPIPPPLFLLQADVIVNTISEDLDLRKGAISTALLQTAGHQLQSEVTRIGRLNNVNYGEMVITNGYNLKCKNVFHVVCPFWKGSEDKVRKKK